MSCFENIPVENIEACINAEVPSGISEVNMNYAVHSDISDFPVPLAIGAVGYTYAKANVIDEDIVFTAGKGFAKIKVQVNTGELTFDGVGSVGNMKQKSGLSFFIPSNDAQLLGFIRTRLNTPMVFAVPERQGQNRLLGDKFNPAYITEVKGTTGKTGEDDKGVQFTVSSFAIPLIYNGAIQEVAIIP
jgi:hypothetical protein